MEEKQDLFILKSVSKSYGQTKALRDCSFSVRKGETHAFIGENGSGKSTLVKCLSGVLSPDGGEIILDGESFRTMKNPKFARVHGIGTSFQEILIVPTLTVYENIALGVNTKIFNLYNKNEFRDDAQVLFDELSGGGISLDTKISALEISKQQLCVIARCLLTKPKVAILDEATAALDASDCDRLFKTMARMKKEYGTSFIFISHRMDEIMDIADRVTVLRVGETVATLEKEEISAQKMVQLMSGDVQQLKRSEIERDIPDVPCIITKNIKLAEDADTFDFTLRKGEVLGVAGLEGQGQEMFIESLVGRVSPLGGSVSIVADGKEKTFRNMKEAADLGIVYVPRNRKTEGIFETQSIIDNFALPALGRYMKGILVSNAKVKEAYENYHKSLAIRTDRPLNPISTLSGGNQQKVLIARWLNMNPRVIVFNDPTRGVDPKTKHDIYRTIRELAEKGVTVVFLSTEVEEIVACVDRAIIFRDNKIEAEIPGRELSSEKVIAAFFGQEGEKAS